MITGLVSLDLYAKISQNIRKYFFCQEVENGCQIKEKWKKESP
jgi:hypothetical protein